MSVQTVPRLLLLIGGTELPASTGATFQAFDPATGEPLAELASASAADVDAATRAARNAFDRGRDWQLPARRVAPLYRIAEVLRERGVELATVE
jgi:acyl-CoA reductase-like NAD-dependent aldehyde dehydrogenase